MKSKEEILRQHVEKYYYHKGRVLSDDDILPLSRVRPLLDEYAKQEAIAFAKWIKINADHAKGDWYLTAAMSGDIYDTEQLYNLYLESKKQKV